MHNSTLAKGEMRERLKSHYSEPRNAINQLNFPIQLHQLQLITEPGWALVFVWRNRGHSSQQLI